MSLPRKVYLATRRGYLAPPVVIILALITLAVAATLILQAKFFSAGKNPSPTPPPAAISPTPAPKTSPQPSPTPDETANWETYIYQRLNISIKYPPQFKVTEHGAWTFFNTDDEKSKLEKCLAFQEANRYMTIECNSHMLEIDFIESPTHFISSKPIADDFQTIKNQRSGSRTDITIDGYQAFYTVGEGIGPSQINNLYVNKDGKLYQITGSSSIDIQKNMGIYLKMLNTIKFLK